MCQSKQHCRSHRGIDFAAAHSLFQMKNSKPAETKLHIASTGANRNMTADQDDGERDERTTSEQKAVSEHMAELQARPNNLNKFRNRKYGILEISEILANITIVCGLLIAALTFYQQRSEVKIRSSEELLRQFHTPHLSDATSLLSDLWSEQDLSIFQAGLPRKAINALIDASAEAQGIDDRDLNTAIFVVAQYLDFLEACMAAEKCDPDTINIRMAEYARNFFCTYQGHIFEQARRILLPIGNELSKWASRNGGCTASQNEATAE